jgi:hypothetical protein
MELRWSEIQDIIDKFQEFLAPDDVMQLKVQKGIDRRSGIEFSEQCGALTNRGVYLFFDGSDSLRYVGCASLQPFGRRIPQSIKKLQEKRWIDIWEELRWVDVITFNYERSFFAPALEKYLIEEGYGRGWELKNKLGISGLSIPALKRIACRRFPP